ncbi:MAG: DUF120 domain-containing protein [Okeania sp. SIO2G4]|uniref:DUF120 domain-containing protein n=1 Tax=unclassified Okeania TaxID=2634635 RepID=UPI0013BA7E42|nr:MULTISPECIES: DUF120 domain-containing protein [unclassified Okeania]NEP73497.1 DUF120 domain-containing protein [Okeania sp. SIO2G5]NEP94215.1 DUF120 domain-containing protein [Okeania sp. SIO2F5]NEQ92169.1 DUF120 domain-containing protein [Okeania sp. SIO2G4]
MSYVAIATEQFDTVVAFYGDQLGFPVVEQWDRPNGRGIRFDLGGMRLEILDNQRERSALSLGQPGDSFHIVIEVDDIEATQRQLAIDTPEPQSTSWGARLFQLRDPDGVPVTFLEWVDATGAMQEIRGQLASGVGRGSHFTRLDWVRTQFIDSVSIDPFPGTANVIVKDPTSLSRWNRLRCQPGIKIVNPNSGPNDCNARCFPVVVDGIVDAAIVLPDVEGYAKDQIEIIASVNLRDTLGKSDGDIIVLRIKEPDVS